MQGLRDLLERLQGELKFQKARNEALNFDVVGGSTIASPLVTNLDVAKKMPLNVIHGLHLTSATSWYMLSIPQEAPAWTFLKHRDYPIPQIFEVDAQLTASRKFRIEYPTQVIQNYLNPGTNTKPMGAYKST